MAQAPSQSNGSSGQRNLFWFGLAAVLVVGLLVLLGFELFSDRDAAFAIGQSPPDFTLQTYGGGSLQTADLRGRILVINFWSSWCTTCDEEAQMLEEAWEAYQSQGEDVVFIGVAYMDTEPDAMAFLETYAVTYPNGPDLRGEISNLYQVSSVPETYILDANGVLRGIKIGPFTSTEEVYRAIEGAADAE
jgi:cytochrome c biogenesis protein CcmG/thiol:disulfide interchange protein DsbE